MFTLYLFFLFSLACIYYVAKEEIDMLLLDLRVRMLLTSVNRSLADNVKSLQVKPRKLRFSSLEGAIASVTAIHASDGGLMPVADIEIDIKRAIRTMRELSLKRFLMEYKFTLLHEYRHIWQMEHDPSRYYGTELKSPVSVEAIKELRISLLGYGSIPKEADANRWAVSQASCEVERAVFRLAEIQQRLLGAFAPNKQLLQEGIRLEKALENIL